jgi:hypothetical protein
MKKLLMILLLAATVPLLFAAGDLWPPRERVGHITPTTTTSPGYINNFNKYWNEPAYVYAFNSYTDTLLKGHVVVWDDAKTLIDSAAYATACDTLVLADSLTANHWHNIRIKWLNTVSACSLDIKGLDTNNVAQTETKVFTGSTASTYSTKLWRKVNLMVWRHGTTNDSLVVYGIHYMSVKATTSGDNINCAGVVADTALTDSIVKIQIRGVVQCYVTADVEVLPGITIHGSSGTAGYGAADATEVTGASIGKALESGVTAKLYWIQLDLQ